MRIDNKGLHRDILVRLRCDGMTQGDLCRELNIGRNTLYRLSVGDNLRIDSYFIILEWLDRDICKYIIKEKGAELTTPNHSNKT